MIRFFNKITKTIIIVLGFVILVIITAIGGAGLYYKQQAQSFYSNVKNIAVSSLDTVKSSIESVQSNLTTTVENIGPMLTSANSSIDSSIEALQQIKTSIPPDSASSKQIDDAITSLTSLKTQLTDFGNDATKVPDNLNSIIDSITSSGVYTTIQTIIDKLPTDDQFNATYSSASIGLTAAGGSILGIYTLTIILNFVFFKHVCGFRVRRFHKNSDLIKHVDKIFEKYPEVYHEFYPGN